MHVMRMRVASVSVVDKTITMATKTDFSNVYVAIKISTIHTKLTITPFSPIRRDKTAFLEVK